MKVKLLEAWSRYNNFKHKKFINIALLVFSISAVTVVGVRIVEPSRAETNFGPSFGRPFATTSAWNSPIGQNVQLDPNSAGMVSNLASDPAGGIAGLYAFGHPIYAANAATPRYKVDCTMPWGVCQLEQESVPIPAGATPNSGSDGKLMVIDYSTGKVYEFWQYSWNNGSPKTSWGNVVPDVYNGPGQRGATGAGIATLAGMVRLHEVRNGVIDHALAFSTKFCQGPIGSTNFRYPATATDGKYFGANPVPEGARVQLDPSINVDAIPGITAGEKMVAKALQKYGAYNIDCGGAAMAYNFELPKAGEANPYPGIGFGWDYFGMKNIPWNKIRVLKSWNSYDGTATAPPSATLDTVAPTVKIISPVSGSQLAGSVTVTAESTDNVGVAKIELIVAGKLMGASTTSPSKMTFDTKALPNGQHILTVNAYDARNNVASQRITVTINNTVNTVDSAPPTAPVSLSAPTVSASTISLAWSAATDNVAVTRYEVWRGDANWGNWVLAGIVPGSTATYVDSSLQPATVYTFGVRAYDAAGNRSDGSPVISARTSAVSTGQLTFSNSKIMAYGKCLDVKGWGTANGTPLVLYSCHGGLNQRFDLTQTGELRSRLVANKCIDVPGANTADGTKLQMYTCNGTIAQKWKSTATGQFVGVGGKCMDVVYGLSADSTPIWLYTCNTSSAQKWTVAF